MRSACVPVGRAVGRSLFESVLAYMPTFGNAAKDSRRRVFSDVLISGGLHSLARPSGGLVKVERSRLSLERRGVRCERGYCDSRQLTLERRVRSVGPPRLLGSGVDFAYGRMSIDVRLSRLRVASHWRRGGCEAQL